MLALWSNVCYVGLWIYWFHDHDATIPNSTDVITQCGPFGVELDRAANVTYGMFRAMDRALALYYRSLGTTSTLLRRGDIYLG